MTDLQESFLRLMPEQFEALFSSVRFGQFLSVGVVGAICDNTMLAVLGLGFGMPEMWAKAGGIETAILVMFLFNEYWTFSMVGAAGTRPFLTRLGKSHLVRSGGVVVQLSVYWLLTQWLEFELFVGGTDLWFIAASPIAITVAMSINYIFESMFTWQVHLKS